MFSFIGAIIIGGLAGLVAKFLMPGRDPGGFIITILLGIGGAMLATWLGQAVGWYRTGDSAGFIGAVIGAVLILFIYRMIAQRRVNGMRAVVFLAVLVSGCGEPGGPPLISAQSPPSVNAANSQPQPEGSLPPGAGGIGPGAVHPTYFGWTFRL